MLCDSDRCNLLRALVSSLSNQCDQSPGMVRTDTGPDQISSSNVVKEVNILLEISADPLRMALRNCRT